MAKSWLQRTREGCVFCRMVDGREPRPEDWQDHGKIVSFTPLEPVTPGHRLFVPKFHEPNASSDPALTGSAFTQAAKWARHNGPTIQDHNLIINSGRAATQSVFHVHVHYVPRAKDDGLALPWYSGASNHG